MIIPWRDNQRTQHARARTRSRCRPSNRTPSERYSGRQAGERQNLAGWIADLEGHRATKSTRPCQKVIPLLHTFYGVVHWARCRTSQFRPEVGVELHARIAWLLVNEDPT